MRMVVVRLGPLPHWVAMPKGATSTRPSAWLRRCCISLLLVASRPAAAQATRLSGQPGFRVLWQYPNPGEGDSCKPGINIPILPCLPACLPAYSSEMPHRNSDRIILWLLLLLVWALPIQAPRVLSYFAHVAVSKHVASSCFLSLQFLVLQNRIL